MNRRARGRWPGAALVCSLALLESCGYRDVDSSSAQRPDELSIQWSQGGSASALVGLDALRISLPLNVLRTAQKHSVLLSDGPMAERSVVDLTDGTRSLCIVTGSSDMTAALVISHGIWAADETFDSFADFLGALSKEVSLQTGVTAIEAIGRFDGASKTFSVNAMVISLED